MRKEMSESKRKKNKKIWMNEFKEKSKIVEQETEKNKRA